MYSYIVIDDEVNIRKGLIKKIKDAGGDKYVCVAEADNGQKGLELIEETKPDIIITDMKMNKMDGIHFLEALRGRKMNQPVIVISSFKDFEYMQKSIECRVIGYVLKPFSAEEIARELNKAVKDILEREQNARNTLEEDQNKMLQDILLGNMQDQFLEEQLYPGICHLRLITVNRKSGSFLGEAVAVCREKAQSVKWHIVRNPMLKTQFFIVLYVNQDKEKFLDLKTSQMLEALKMQYEKESVIVCVSKNAHGIQSLGTLRKNNDKALRSLYIGQPVSVLYSENLEQSKMIYSQECMENWISRMKFEPGEIESVLNSFFDNMDIRQFTLGDIRKTCKYMLARVNNYAEENGIEGDDIIRFFETRYPFERDMERIKKETIGYIKLIFLSVNDQEQKEQDIYETITAYIRKNYNKKITLSMIADSVYMNQSLCRKFLKDHGTNFNDYLTEIRMKHAKQLLDNSKISIEYISGEVGYANPKYFYKIFKKEIGVTPQEYRNRIISQKGEAENYDN